jgi:DNA polymerase V
LSAVKVVVNNANEMSFPSPALDFDEVKIDLNRELIWHPASTFFGRVKGDSMRDAGIGDGDLLVIDKSLEPANGRIAVCFMDGEFTVKRIEMEKGGTFLVSANPQFAPVQLTDPNDLRIWGIVTYCIKDLYKQMTT